MEYTPCNCCGSTKLKKIYEKPDEKFFPDEWFSVVECAECGLGFVNPRPSETEINKYYPKDFYSYFRDIDHTNRYMEEAKYLNDIALKKQNPKLLDIGCANGDFPRFMQKKGWIVEGVEPSITSDPIDDFTIYRKNLTELELKTGYYDAVTAWAVLEHTHNPKDYFKRIGKILAKNGRFVFLVTNFESLASKYLFAEDIPRHLFFFTPKTITRYLETSGMKLLKIDYSDKIYMMRSMHSLLFYIKYLSGQKLLYSDIPLSYAKFLQKNNLKDTLIKKIIYSSKNPLFISEKFFSFFFDKLLIILKKYGIIICMAEKK